MSPTPERRTETGLESDQAAQPTIDRWGDQLIGPGKVVNLRLSVGESYSGLDVRISEDTGPNIDLDRTFR